MLPSRIHKFLLAGFLLFAGIPGYSQLISLGVKGGVPLMDPLDTSQTGAAGATHAVRRYIVGGTGEFHLPFGLSIEVDALYRRLGYETFVASKLVIAQSNIKSSDWQFPLLAKYEFKRRPFVRPFVDGGLTFRHVGFSDIANPNTAGITVGGGLSLKLLLLRLSPEIRYTHFPTEIFGSNFPFVHSTSNQVDFLVGFTF